MSRSLLLLTLAILPALAVACGDHDHDHDQDHAEKAAGHEEGRHGGHVLELGAVAHVEVRHDAATGTMRLWLTGPDAATALAPATPPVLKLVTDKGPLVLPFRTAGAGSEFELADEALESEHLEGRITVTIGDTVFNPDLERTHHH